MLRSIRPPSTSFFGDSFAAAVFIGYHASEWTAAAVTIGSLHIAKQAKLAKDSLNNRL